MPPPAQSQFSFPLCTHPEKVNWIGVSAAVDALLVEEEDEEDEEDEEGEEDEEDEEGALVCAATIVMAAKSMHVTRTAIDVPRCMAAKDRMLTRQRQDRRVRRKASKQIGKYHAGESGRSKV